MRKEKKSYDRETERKKRRIKETAGKSGSEKYEERIFFLYLCNKCTLYVNNHLFLVGPVPICRALQTRIGPTRNRIPKKNLIVYTAASK
jgi:hypothetical protein